MYSKIEVTTLIQADERDFIDGHFNCPEVITIIGENAFDAQENLKSITLLPGIISIEEEAFSGTNLNTITLPQGVATIGERAFAWCPNLKTVTLPHGIILFKNHVFEGCANLKYIIIDSEDDNEIMRVRSFFSEDTRAKDWQDKVIKKSSYQAITAGLSFFNRPLSITNDNLDVTTPINNGL